MTQRAQGFEGSAAPRRRRLPWDLLRNNPVYVAVNWVIPYLLPSLLSLSVCVCLSLRLLCLCSVCMYVFVYLCARAARKSKRSGGARATRSFRITPIYKPNKFRENRKPGNYSPIGVCSHRLIPLTSASSLLLKVCWSPLLTARRVIWRSPPARAARACFCSATACHEASL